jgi:hypothetical protein
MITEEVPLRSWRGVVRTTSDHHRRKPSLLMILFVSFDHQLHEKATTIIFLS